MKHHANLVCGTNLPVVEAPVDIGVDLLICLRRLCGILLKQLGEDDCSQGVVGLDADTAHLRSLALALLQRSSWSSFSDEQNQFLLAGTGWCAGICL